MRSLLAPLGKALLGGSHSQRTRMFVRNHYRRLCVDTEYPITTRYGFKINASPRDYASYGIYFFGEYDARMTDVIRHFLRPGMTAWDVGTERGWFTCLMASCVGKSGRVDAFEAFPGNAQRLRANLALNDFPQVHVHAMAVSDRPGVLRFEPPSDAVTHHKAYLSDCSGVGYLTSEPSATAIEVPSVTLDEVADREGIHRLDFIKMDIEGAETAALRGAEKTLRKFRPVLAVEYNRATLRRANSSLEELDAFIDQLGYDRLHMATTFRPVNLEQSRNLPDEKVVFNAYCYPREQRAALIAAA